MSTKTKPAATKKEAKSALVPKLRFPEFRESEPWKDIAIESILDVRDERRVPTTDAPLFSLTIENGITKKTDRYNREFLVRDAQNKKYKLVEPNDIVYNPSNLRWGAINYSQLSHSVVVSPIYEVLSLRDARKHFLEFIAAAVMRTEQIRRFITKAQGTLVERIAVKIEDFLSTKLSVPPNHAEQKQIAECLSSVDELMAAQARKVDALKTHKKGLMRQLFPREGETQPRLRFPEFRNAGEWEDNSLGDVCELYQPVTLSSSELSMTGEHLVYGANGVIGTHNQYNHEETEIAVTCRGATCGEVTLTKPKSWITGNAMVVKPRTKNLRRDFIFQYFKNHGLKTVISGSAQPQITRTGFAPLLVFFPEPKEQERIASCLSSLDNLITAATQKLEALRTHKKGLMQQLFPLSQEN